MGYSGTSNFQTLQDVTPIELKMNSQDHVVIVGAGTFGLSTALELLRKGHKNVTLIDSHPIPSPLSAGNDVNKVFQSTVEDHFYSELALEALEKWRSDKLYKQAFHEVGIVYGGVGDQAVNEINRRYELLRSQGVPVEKLNSPKEFKNAVKTEGKFEGWSGYHQKARCGWTLAKLALENVSTKCLEMGANFICDKVDELIFGNQGTCTGVKTFSGTVINAHKVILSAGASSIGLLDFKGQLLAKCWTVGHIKLTEGEAESLKGTPVILNIDEGFVFEPDCNNEIKFCNEFPGYINVQKGISIPVYRNEIPEEAKEQMRQFLHQVFPEIIASREFCVSKICWCTDTPDRHFLFCEHPEHKGLILATGDSGKGFKYMPIVGEYISEIALKGDRALDEEKRKAWGWRPELAVDRDIYKLQQRMGGLNIIKDLKDIDKWTS
jgi:sarcosine oxidase/L-pipecolate oxidase